MRKSTAMVYVIGNAGSETVKIGISIDPVKRLGELRKSWTPDGVDRHALEILRVYRTSSARSLEDFIHWVLTDSRLRVNTSGGLSRCGYTEWFQIPDPVATVDAVARRYVGSTQMGVRASAT